MRICAAADLHFPRQGVEWAQEVGRTMCEQEAEVLLLAGDVSAGDPAQYAQVLETFETCRGLKLFVPGNHDLWEASEARDTWRRYHTGLRGIVDGLGFHYLPGAPVALGDVGFVGTSGWYDYSFRQENAPSDELLVTPLQAKRADDATLVEPLTSGPVAWRDLTPELYEGKALMWHEKGEWQSAMWNDAVYTDWGMPDEEVVAHMASELAADLEALPASVTRVVAVTHHVPDRGLLGGPTSSVNIAYTRAFMGADRIGQVLAADPRVRLVLYGHTHAQRTTERGGVAYVNCSVGDGAGGPLLLEVPEAEA